MPAYSFKERFVPWVKDGSKPGTIRDFRKHPVKVGQLAHLFYGMRTKFCTKLVDPAPVIHTVNCVLLRANGTMAIIYINWLDEPVRKRILAGEDLREVGVVNLTVEMGKHHSDEFAWKDGFRHSDDPEKKEGCFDLMLRYWRQTTGLPFLGNHILWG